MTSGSIAENSRKTARANTVEVNPKKGRSRLTNGRVLLPGVDGRSTWARLLRDVVSAMYAHLGGEDLASEPQRMLVRRVACFEAELCHLEFAFAQARAEGRTPEAADLDLYSRMSSAQRRLLEAVGLDRVPKDVTPSLSEYIAQKGREKALAAQGGAE
jgi:hypothetical protein